MNKLRWFVLASGLAPFIAAAGCGVDDETSSPDSVVQSQQSVADLRKRCHGSTPTGSTNWKQNGSDSLYVDISIAGCGLGIVPVYFASLSGSSGHNRTLGSSSIYNPTSSGFRIHIVNLAGAITPALANQKNWAVNWEAVSETKYSGSSGLGGAGYGTAAVWINNGKECVGRTVAGSTAWKVQSEDYIYVDVDISACGLTSIPNLITSLGGTSAHKLAKGVSSIYKLTTTGFRIYLNSPGITPDTVNAKGWHVNWKASPQNTNDSLLCTGTTNSSAWVQHATDPNDIYQDIDTSACALQLPWYQTSLEGTQHHSKTVGATSIYRASTTGLRIHVRSEAGALTPSQAATDNWHINWAADHVY
jgi:hypothetical protein